MIDIGAKDFILINENTPARADFQSVCCCVYSSAIDYAGEKDLLDKLLE